MSEEIKEILDKLNKTADNPLFVICSSQKELDKIPKYTANFLSVNDRQAKLLLNYITSLQQKVEEKDKEIDRLNNIINELENTIENFMENHTEGYLDWKYDREIYLAESNVLQKLYDTYFDKLKALKENK